MRRPRVPGAGWAATRASTASRHLAARSPLEGVGRDGRRPDLLSAFGRRLREAGSGFDALTFDGAVDGGAADAEEFGNFQGAVLAAVYQGHQVCFLAAVQLRLLAP